jgi:carbamate kinase
MGRLAVVAIGGNSLIRDADHQTVQDQNETISETSRHIARMVHHGYDVIITHGNGPQVGFILLRSELARNFLHPVPLDACDADTQGALGYAIQRSLGNEFRRLGIEKNVATLITQVVVDRDDPAFQTPSKPIGPFYDRKEALAKAQNEGWAVKEDSGRGYRRLVASPFPRRIVELDAVRTLVSSGFVVVAAGGGGIPVVEENGDLVGVEAVIDKDHASSLLARDLGVDLFLICTSVPRVYLHFGTDLERPLDAMTVEQASRYLEEGHFAEGSMAPKIRASISYLEAVDGQVIITSPELIEDALEEKAGTRITR